VALKAIIGKNRADALVETQLSGDCGGCVGGKSKCHRSQCSGGSDQETATKEALEHKL